MNDIKACVAKNITELRQGKGLTQLELAEKLNYSDKAISKWERGESLPDVSVLLELADIFGVSLDYLVRAEGDEKRVKESIKTQPKYNHTMIMGVSIQLVWFIALLVFVMISLIMGRFSFQWLSFIYAVPVTMIVWLVFNSIWFNRRLNYFIISLLMWSVLASIHISFLIFDINIWLLYLLGLPGQTIILMWSMFKKPKRR